MTVGLPLIKSLLTLLAKNILFLFRLSTWLSAAEAETQKKIDGSGTTALIILNE